MRLTRKNGGVGKLNKLSSFSQIRPTCKQKQYGSLKPSQEGRREKERKPENAEYQTGYIHFNVP